MLTRTSSVTFIARATSQLCKRIIHVSIKVGRQSFTSDLYVYGACAKNSNKEFFFTSINNEEANKKGKCMVKGLWL